MVLTGDSRGPFGEMKYVVEEAFLKRIELPFYGEIKMAEECVLVINSHVTEEGREKDGEAIYQCRVGVKFCVPISSISGQGVWMSIDFGESYQLYVNFDEGISLDNAADFIASITGKSSLPDIPIPFFDRGQGGARAE
ncbi:hypothetical protein D3Z62_19555 [Lachnospiraceae bacterium]|nr:hypothetical protein [Ruminococcus sp.]NBJ02237.1 hypothetical protein [Lachnospiraceae bacterium]